jgi:Prephenate dehydrogenase
LAKSNPAMWVPIFIQNKENVLDVLDEHIEQLKKFRDSIVNENGNELKGLIEEANEIRRIIE